MNNAIEYDKVKTENISTWFTLFYKKFNFYLNYWVMLVIPAKKYRKWQIMKKYEKILNFFHKKSFGNCGFSSNSSNSLNSMIEV